MWILLLYISMMKDGHELYTDRTRLLYEGAPLHMYSKPMKASLSPTLSYASARKFRVDLVRRQSGHYLSQTTFLILLFISTLR